MHLSRWAWCGVSAAWSLTAASCVSVDCRTENAADSFFRSVPAAAGYAVPGDSGEPGNGARVRTQTYSLDDDGMFTFYRSLETDVGHLGIEVEAVGRKKAKESGIEPYEGVQIRSVSSRGTAAEAGLRSGDILLSFEGKDGLSEERLRYLVESSSPGAKVAVGVLRGSESLQVTVTIGAQKQIESGKVFQVLLPLLDDRERSGLKLVELTDEVRPIVLGPEAAAGGLVVRDVLPGGPAFHAGLKVRDVVSAVGEQPVTTLADYERALEALAPGDSVPISYARGGAARSASVEIESDATADGGVHVPILFGYKHRPEHREMSVLMGFLYNYEKCHAVRERRDEPESYTAWGWGALVNLITYSSNSRGRGRLTLLWLIPIWWGDD